MLKANPNKLSRCRICRGEFLKMSMGHVVCSPLCAQALALSVRNKQERKAAAAERVKDRASLLALKPRKWWLAKAKTALHAFIRARDEGKPCISCDTILVKRGNVGGDYDAGHFISVGSAKHMEFVEGNIFGQCKHCNDYLKGNQLEYHARLVTLKGQEYVDELRADQTPRKLTIADFQAIEAEYKAKLKTLLQSKGE